MEGIPIPCVSELEHLTIENVAFRSNIDLVSYSRGQRSGIFFLTAKLEFVALKMLRIQSQLQRKASQECLAAPNQVPKDVDPAGVEDYSHPRGVCFQYTDL